MRYLVGHMLPAGIMKIMGGGVSWESAIVSAEEWIEANKTETETETESENNDGMEHSRP
jgi:hypothetical protein